jgi:hypothetical protein
MENEHEEMIKALREATELMDSASLPRGYKPIYEVAPSLLRPDIATKGLRRTDKGTGDYIVNMEPHTIIAFECEFLIEDSK